MKKQEPNLHTSIEHKFIDSLSLIMVSDETDSSMMQEDSNDVEKFNEQPQCNCDGEVEECDVEIDEEQLSSSEIGNNVGDEEHPYLPKMNASQTDQNENNRNCNNEELDPDHRQEASFETSFSTSSFGYRIRQWLIPISIIAFISFCLVSNVILPYEEKIERRSRPLHLRPVFENLSLPSFPKFSMRELFYDKHQSVNARSRDLDYYQKDVDDQVEEEKNDDQGNDDEQNQGNDDGQNQGNDDGQNVGNNDNYYNATSNQTYYYYDDDYEMIVDDFFRYIDDNFEVQTVFPLQASDYAGFICATLTITLSIGGGIGPGASLIAVYIIVFGFKPKVAIPMNCITLLGVTTLSTVRNMRRRHPLSDRPIIDWDLVLIMEPLTLFGAIAGTYVNKILGQKVLIVLLVLLLSIVAHNTLKRARKMHHAEELYMKRMMWAKQKRRTKQQAPILATLPTVKSFDGKLAEADPPFIPKIHQPAKNASNKDPLLQRNDDSVSKTDSNSVPSDSSFSSYSSSFQSFIVLHKADAESVKSSLIEEESDPLPQHKITYIFTMFLGVIAFNLFKGGASFESPLGIICGSFSFWFVELLTTMWLGCCTFLAARYLLKRHAIKEAVGFDYVRGDIKWDIRTIVIYPIACVFAGFVSGMFGIGCAILIVPMLVGIGVNPQVASATCGCMNFFTGLAAASSYVVLGSLDLYHQYAWVLFLLGIISMLIGRWILSFSFHTTKIKKGKRLERHSYQAYTMGLVVLVSALCMTVEALLDVVMQNYNEDAVDGICDQTMI